MKRIINLIVIGALMMMGGRVIAQDTHEYVDLGLPSGTLWATCNVGANAPEEYGDYFAWGETAPKDVYNWNTYQYCMGSYNTLTKYCNDPNYGYNGFTDTLTTLLPEDDAATANWGNGWRMPTEGEWKELYSNTTVTLIQQDGVNGCLFTAANGNSLFLPATGYRWDSNLDLVGSNGDYWSSSLGTGSDRAWYTFFDPNGHYMRNYGRRSLGRSVRAVYSASVGDDHAYIDLGLPSGTLWATCNVGANAPEEYGDYFAWGETAPKDVYNWNTYQYYDGSNLAKYTGSDGLTTLLPEDDAATTNWGNEWRMPTKEEWQELLDNTTNKWTTQNGVNGRLFTGSNGNSLFLPAVGFRWNDDLNYVRSYGYYWSSSLNTDGSNDAWLFDLYSDYHGMYSLYRGYGQSVRAVRSTTAPLPSYTVTLSSNPTEGGAVSGAGTYEMGTTCTITATANEGYTYINWTENDEVVSTDATYSFVVTGNRNLVANFTAPSTNILSIGNYTGAEGEILTIDINLANEDEVSGFQFDIPLNAGFSYVEGSIAKGERCSLNHIILAQVVNQGTVLRVLCYSMPGTNISSNYGTIASLQILLGEAGTYELGLENCVLQTITGGILPVISTGGTLTVTGGQPVTYNLTATVNPAGAGTVTGAGTYEMGTTCTITATANEGYTFINWTENGEVVSTEAEYSFTVTGDRTLVANFEEIGGDDHAYVDLGLPSGLLWATCNVGANAPEEYGDYFAWGETQPKDVYNWSTYQYCMGSNYTLTKYCDMSFYGYNGFTDNLTILLPEDDAATANWGSDWRMPTEEEWQELYQNTTFTWTQQNGVNGMLFTGSNGNTLFLPAAGCRGNSSLYGVGSSGDYWSSSLITAFDPDYAWIFTFDEPDVYYVTSGNRDYGLSVRAVRAARQN